MELFEDALWMGVLGVAVFFLWRNARAGWRKDD